MKFFKKPVVAVICTVLIVLLSTSLSVKTKFEKKCLEVVDGFYDGELYTGETEVRKRYYSIGGGEIIADGEAHHEHSQIYSLNSFTEISEYCRSRDIRIWQYVEECEGPEIWDYLYQVWEVMKQAIREGLEAEGVLHGGLNIQRKARYLYRQKHIDESDET